VENAYDDCRWLVLRNVKEFTGRPAWDVDSGDAEGGGFTGRMAL
jgi:hypothetical protein